MSNSSASSNDNSEGKKKNTSVRRKIDFSVRERIVPCSTIAIIPFLQDFIAHTFAPPETHERPHEFVEQDIVPGTEISWENPIVTAHTQKLANSTAPEIDRILPIQTIEPGTANSVLYYSTANAPLIKSPEPLPPQGDSPPVQNVEPEVQQIPSRVEDPMTPNLPPEANLDNPFSAKAGESVLFDGTKSFDTDGTITRYSFDFGDGNTYSEFINPSTGGVFAPDGAFDGRTTYTYSDSGSYTTTLTVEDNNGATDTAVNSINITVNAAPIFLNPGDTLPTTPGIENKLIGDPEHTVDKPLTPWIEGKLDAVKNVLDNPATTSIDENANSVDNIVQYGQNWNAIANAYDTDGSIKGYQFWIDVNKDGNYTANEYVGYSTSGDILVDHTKFALQAGQDYNMAVRAIDNSSKASFTNFLLPQKAEPGTAHSFDTFHVNQAPTFLNPGDDLPKIPGVENPNYNPGPGPVIDPNPATPWIEGKLDAVLNDGSASTLNNIVQYQSNWTAIANAYDNDGTIQGYDFWIKDDSGSFVSLGSSTTGLIGVDHTQFDFTAGSDYQMKVIATDNTGATSESFDTFHINEGPVFLTPGDSNPNSPGIETPSLTDPTNIKDIIGTPWIEGSLDAVKNSADPNSLKNIVQEGSTWIAFANAFDPDGTVKNYEFWIDADKDGIYAANEFVGASTTGDIKVDSSFSGFAALKAGEIFSMKAVATDDLGSQTSSFDKFTVSGSFTGGIDAVAVPSIQADIDIINLGDNLDFGINVTTPNGIAATGAYTYSIDGAPIQTFNDLASLTASINAQGPSLTVGTHGLVVTVKDTLGNIGTYNDTIIVSGGISGAIDAVAVPSIQVDTDTINLGSNLNFGIFTSVQNGIAPTGGYTFSFDGAPVQTFNTEADLITAINAAGPSLTAGTHSLIVTVKDTLGNIGNFADTVIVNAPFAGGIDAVAVPSIQSDIDTINLGDTLNFGINVTDANGIAPTGGYTFSFDGAPAQTFNTVGALTAAINAAGPSLTAGTHSLIVTVKDTLGNIGNFADTVIVNAPFAGGIDAVAVPSIQSDIDTINLGDTLNFGINVTDANGIAPAGGYTFSFDGAPAQTFNTVGALTAAINAAGPSLTAGTHSLIVTVKDTLGNIGTYNDTVIVNAPFTGGIDNVTNAPTPGSGISYGSGPDGKAGTADDTFDIDVINQGQNLNFGINVNDANGIAATGAYTASFDGKAAQTFDTIAALTASINAQGSLLSAGSHNLVVTVKDTLGNIGTFNDTVIVNAPFVGGIDAVTNSPIPGSGISYAAGVDGKFGTADDVYDTDVINQGDSLNFSLNVTDANGIAASKAYSYKLDGVDKGSFDTLNLLKAAINAQGPTLSIGTHDLTVNVKDTLGNIGTFIDKVTVKALVASNLPPDAVDDKYYLPQGTLILNLPVLSNDSDPNADPLTITSVGTPLAGSVQIINGGTLLKYVSTGADPVTDTNLVSDTDAPGIQVGDGNSYNVSLSANGQIISFDSDSTDLVSGDSNGFRDIFVKDSTTGIIELISVATNGTQGNGDSFSASISDDGRYVVFSSSASNLVANDTNGVTDVFLHDRVTGTTQIISNGVGGAASNGANDFARISGDGKFIAYGSLATNLVAGDTNGKSDLFLYDVANDSTQIISMGLNSAEGNGDSISGASLSTDGRYIAFRSDASNLVANDNNGTRDIFVFDRVAGSMERVNISSSGVEANGYSTSPSISADGKFVVFRSDANNLVTGDTNNHGDIFIHEMGTGITERISVDSVGNQANDNSYMYNGNQSISADGRYVVFQSDATNLVAFDTNASSDVFVHDRLTNITQRLSVTSSSAQGFSGSQGVAISADGKYAGFESDANNLVSFDNNTKTDIFVRQIITNDSFTYTISDGKGGTDTATVTILPEFSNANAVDDLAVITKGQSVDVNILGNDTGSGANVPVFDSIVTNPGRGVVTANPDGTLHYVPDSSFSSGIDTFVYKMSDGQGNFDTATVTIKIIAAQNDNYGIPIGSVIGNKYGPIDNDTVIGNTSITSVDGQDLKFGSVVISPNGQNILYTPLGISVSDQTISPDGSKIAFVNNANTNKNLYVMNSDGTGLVNITKDSSVFDYNLLQSSAISWSPDGTQISFSNKGDIFVAPADGSSAPISITDGTSIDNKVSLPNSPAIATWSPDGKTIAFTVDTTNTRVDERTTVSGTILYGLYYNGQTPTFNGAVQGLNVSDLDRSLYTINLDTKVVNLMVDAKGAGLDTSLPSWSPDGSKLAFIGTNDNDANSLPGSQITSSSHQVYVMNADGTGLKNLTFSNISVATEAPISWSPDGTKIALEDTSQHIWVVDVNTGTSGLTNITPDGITPSYFAGRYGSPFSYTDTHSNTYLTADKQALFFTATDGHLYRMGIDGSGLTDITQGNIELNSRFVLQWSPNNAHGFFMDANKDLFMINQDGSGLINLTSATGAQFNFESIVWSPDGSKGLFQAPSIVGYGDGVTYVIGSDGSGLTTLTGNIMADRQSFVWSPDSSKILFEVTGPTSHNTYTGSGNDAGGYTRELYMVNADGTNLVSLSGAIKAQIGDDGNPLGTDIYINGGGPLANGDGYYQIGYGYYGINANVAYGQPSSATDTNTLAALNKLTWSPDSQHVVFAASYGYEPIPGFGHGPTWSPSLTELFQVDVNGLNVTNLTQGIDGMGHVNYAAGTHTISFTDKDQNLYLYHYGDAAPVSVANLINSPSVLNYTHFQWSNDGKHAAFIDNDNDLYVFQLNGTNSSTWSVSGFTNLTNNNVQVSDFTFSPDGQKIIYRESQYTGNSFSSDKLFIANADGTGTITQLGNENFYGTSGASKILSSINWTDDSKGFFVGRVENLANTSLFMIDGTTNTLTNLTNTNGIDVSVPGPGPTVYYSPSFYSRDTFEIPSAYALGLDTSKVIQSSIIWSHDGNQFAFVGTSTNLNNDVGYGSSSDIWVVNKDGSGLRNLTQEQIVTSQGNFQWSPDDKSILAIGANEALPTHASTGGKLFSISLADSQIKEIANDIFLPNAPGGLPPTFLDNTHILFQTVNGQLITTDLNGFSGAIKLTNDSIGTSTTDYFSPVWSPDGTTIAFHGSLGQVVHNTVAGLEGSITENNAIFVVDATGNAPPQIVGVNGTSPAWSTVNGQQTLTFVINDPYNSTSQGHLIELNVNNSQGSINYFSKIDTILNEVIVSNGGLSSIKDITWNDQAKVVFTLSDDLYVANQDGTGLINITSNFADSVSDHFFVSDDGTKIVFMTFDGNNNTNNLYEVSSDGSGLIKQIATNVNLRTYTGDPVIAISASGKVAFFATINNSTNAIFEYDGNQLINLTQNQDPYSVDGLATQIAFSASEDRIIYSQYNSFIKSLDVATGNITTLSNNLNLIDSGKFTLSPDGNKIFFNTDNGFYSVNVDGSNSHILVSSASILGGSTANASLSPTGLKVAFEYDHDVYIMNANGSGLQKVNGLFLTQGAPLWSPDGTKLVAEVLNANNQYSASLGYNNLIVVNADGSNLKIVAANIQSSSYGTVNNTSRLLPFTSWSPDGTKLLTQDGLIIDTSSEYKDIIYEAFQYTITDSYVNTAGAVENFNTSGQVASLNGHLSNSQLTNSNKVAFFKNGEIYLSNKDGSDLSSLTLNVPAVTVAGQLQLSPNDTTVAFVDQSGDLNLINTNGILTDLSTSLNLTSVHADSLRWMPDGSKFVFIAGTGVNAELYSLNADGTGLVNLTGGIAEGGNGVLSTSISTDGKIFFSSFSPTSNRVETYMVSDSVGGHSSQSSISKDGRFVAFESSASNLVLGDTNKSTDVFVRDTVTGSIERVSVDSDGNQANGSSSFNSMSTDGRFIVFESSASNLVAGDTNGKTDIFVFDRFTGITERVSDGLGAAEANGDSNWGAISADGRFVAFTSTASNLVAGDTNGVGDIFVYDRQTQSTEKISVGLGGTEANGLSPGGMSISADGRFIAFRSDASNLVANDTNNLRDIFVYDRQTDTTQRVNLDSAGNQANGYSSAPAISADGKYVVFWSDANNLDPLDASSPKDGTGSSVFRHNLATGQTELVSVDVNGNSANGISNALLNAESISEDGRYVAFVSTSDQLTASDTNGKWDLFVKDMLTGTTKLVSNASNGTQSNDDIWGYHLSADGNNVSFASYANNFDVRDLNNNNLDIYTHKISTGETKLVSDGTNILHITDNLGTTDLSVNSAVSPDGKYTAYIGTNNELYLISDSGRQLINLTDGPLQVSNQAYYNLNWSPDSSEFLVNATNGNLYLVHADTQQLIQVTSGGVNVSATSVVWSNDSHRVVFQGYTNPNNSPYNYNWTYSIYTFSENTGLTNIGSLPQYGGATALQLSPNGSSGSFILGTDLYAFNVAGGIHNITNGVQQLQSSNAYPDKSVNFSADGSQGSFLGYDPNEVVKAQNELYSIDASNLNASQLNQGSNDAVTYNDLKVSNLIWSPDGEEAYFTNMTIDNSNPYGSSARNDLFLYKADGSIVNLTPGGIALANLGYYPPKWSPDGDSLLFMGGTQSPNYQTNLYLSDASGSVTKVIDNFNQNYYSTINNSADNNSFLFQYSEDRYSSGQYVGSFTNIYSVEYDTSQVTNLTQSLETLLPNGYSIGDASKIVWSPDNSKFLLPTFSHVSGGVATYYTLIVNADGSGYTQLSGFPSNPSAINNSYQWSPDQQEIAFITNGSYLNNYQVDIWTVKTDGSAPAINITNGSVSGIGSVSSTYNNQTGVTTYNLPYNWSSDGDHLVFQAKIGSSSLSDLYVANDDGSGLANLTPGSSVDISGGYAFSANGSKGYFISNDKDLFTFNPDGTGLTNITNGAIDVQSGNINSTGTLFYLSNVPYQSNNFKTDLFVAHTDGTGGLVNVTNLNNATSFVNWSSPSWSANGSKLFYYQDPSTGSFYDDASQPVMYDPTTNTTIQLVGNFSPVYNQYGLTGYTGSSTYAMYKSPDGSHYFFGDKQTGDIYSMNVDGSNLQNLTNGSIDINTGFSRTIQASPDGKHIVFRDSTDNLYMMESDGSSLRTLTTGSGINPTDPNIVWSADGSKGFMIGTSTVDLSPGNPISYENIYTFNTTGAANFTDITASLQSQVGYLNIGNGGITFSPDGSKIFFAASYGDTRNLFVIDSDGTDLINLTNDSVRFMGNPDTTWGTYASVDGFADNSSQYFSNRPLWSSDGLKLAFNASIAGTEFVNDLYVFDFSTSSLTDVTDGLNYYTQARALGTASAYLNGQYSPGSSLALQGQTIWSADNTKLYFAADTDSSSVYVNEYYSSQNTEYDVLVFDISSKALTNLTANLSSIGHSPYSLPSIYSSPDRSQVFYEYLDPTTKTGYNIYEFKVDGSSLTNITKGIVDANNFTSVSRNLDSVFFTDSQTNDLWNFNPTTHSLSNVTNGLVDVNGSTNINGNSNFKWSPDGSKLTFSANNELLLVNSDGTGFVNITDGSLGVQFSNSYTSSDWSPDSSKISFLGTNGVLYAVDADGTDLTAISSGAAGSVNSPTIEWSPDHKSAIFTTNLGTFSNRNDAVYLYNPDVSSTAIKLTPDATYNSLPSGIADWSPDGSKIAFYSLNKLFIANSDGTGVTSITNNGLTLGYVGGTQDASFTWSADGQHLFFVADANINDNNYLADLYIVNADGTGLTNLSNGNFKINSELKLNLENGRIEFKATVIQNGNPINEVFTVRGDGTGLTQLTKGLGTPTTITTYGMTADGSKILFTDNQQLSISSYVSGKGLYVAPTDSSGNETLITNNFSQATISSDGDDVIFTRQTGNNGIAAYLAKVNSPASPLELTINIDVRNALEYSLSNGLVQWSADGSSVAFVGNDIIPLANGYTRNNLLYVMNPSGTLVASYDLPVNPLTEQFVNTGNTGAYNSNGQFVGGYSYIQDGTGPYDASGNIPHIGYSLVHDGTGPLNATGHPAGGYSLTDTGNGPFNSNGQFVGGYSDDGNGNFYNDGQGSYDQNGQFVGGYSYQYDGVGQYNQAGVLDPSGYSLVNDGVGSYDYYGNNYAGHSFAYNGTGAFDSQGQLVGGYSLQAIPLTIYDGQGAYDQSGNLVGGYSLDNDGNGPYDSSGNLAGGYSLTNDGTGPYDANGNLLGGYSFAFAGYNAPYDQNGNLVGGYYDDGNGNFVYDGYSPYDSSGNLMRGFYNDGNGNFIYDGYGYNPYDANGNLVAGYTYSYDGTGPYDASGNLVQGGYSLVNDGTGPYDSSGYHAGGYSLVNTGSTGRFDATGQDVGGYLLNSGSSANPPILTINDFEWSHDNSTIEVQGGISPGGYNASSAQIQQIYIVDVSGSLVNSDDKATINLSYNPTPPFIGN